MATATALSTSLRPRRATSFLSAVAAVSLPVPSCTVRLQESRPAAAAPAASEVFESTNCAIPTAAKGDVRHRYGREYFPVATVVEQKNENLCLYGFPNESWEVNLPAEEVPPEFPEPVLGINFARDGMQEKEWLSMVAAYSDAWLLSVAFYFGARFGFNKNDRKHLYSLIDDLPMAFEIVSGKSETKVLAPPSSSSHSSIKSKSNNKK